MPSFKHENRIPLLGPHDAVKCDKKTSGAISRDMRAHVRTTRGTPRFAGPSARLREALAKRNEGVSGMSRPAQSPDETEAYTAGVGGRGPAAGHAKQRETAGAQ